MNPQKISIIFITTILMTSVLIACSDDEAGDWEPVPDDDDDDTNGCDCEVTGEQWQSLLDECRSAVAALYETFDDPTADSLCEACDACLVGCFQDYNYCTTDFVSCFWDCAGK